MFSEIQKAEIRQLAGKIVEFEKWNTLSWHDAWSATYPTPPTREEIEREACALERKAFRIVSGGAIANEYADITDHARMVGLESAKTL